MEVTVHNFNDNIAEKMVKKLIELIEQREQVKINYKIQKVEN